MKEMFKLEAVKLKTLDQHNSNEPFPVFGSREIFSFWAINEAENNNQQFDIVRQMLPNIANVSQLNYHWSNRDVIQSVKSQLQHWPLWSSERLYLISEF